MIGSKAIEKLVSLCNLNNTNVLYAGTFVLFSVITVFVFETLCKKKEVILEEEKEKEEVSEEKEKENLEEEKNVLKFIALKTLVKNLSLHVCNLEDRYDENFNNIQFRLEEGKKEVSILKEKINEFERLCQDD